MSWMNVVLKVSVAVILISLLWIPAAPATQIDVVLKFASLAAAKADPVIQQHRDTVEDLFAEDRVIPNMQVWRASQDVNGVHTPLSGWFLLISLESGRIPNALRDHASVQVVINRDKANARQAGAIIRSTVSQALLQDLRFQPVFAGSDYPWGNWQ